jgi:hypothetical protein
MERKIGFEWPFRSSRKFGGIPEKGEWCAHGGFILLNGIKVPPPEWSRPGTGRHTRDTWFLPPNEEPYDDDYFPWTRPPIHLELAKGDNTILFKVPVGFEGQNWRLFFAPLKIDSNGKWMEDNELSFTL